MKIALACGGSRGDVQPTLALGLALQRAGHFVKLIAPPENEKWAKDLGLAFEGLSISAREMLDGMSPDMDLRLLLRFMKLLHQGICDQLEELPRMIRGYDLAVGVSLVFALKAAAEYAGVPYLFMPTTPQMLPSADHPTVAARNHYLPKWLNRVDWWAAEKVNRMTWMRSVNKARRRWGMEKVRGSVWRHLYQPRVMVACDPELGRAPVNQNQWEVFQPGHLALEDKAGLSPELEAFIARGKPPVYLGFGSMPQKGEQTTRLVMDTAREFDGRLVIGAGWAEIRDRRPHEDHIVVGDVPHKALFPKMAAVVHHGGAGTCATAARAGVPQVIVPHLLDQFYWARRIHEAGLGPRGVARNKLNGKKLARLILEARSAPGYAAAARNLAGVLNARDSLARAVDFIEARYSPGPRAKADIHKKS